MKVLELPYSSCSSHSLILPEWLLQRLHSHYLGLGSSPAWWYPPPSLNVTLFLSFLILLSISRVALEEFYLVLTRIVEFILLSLSIVMALFLISLVFFMKMSLHMIRFYYIVALLIPLLSWRILKQWVVILPPRERVLHLLYISHTYPF